ncbi:MAG: hypothetical protein NC241_03745 [Bacteroides sp.]|nr:hypothetical protein [Bacteroides sp.]MCM1456301.1 hypothetical protein [Lachnoclostridium sp.]
MKNNILKVIIGLVFIGIFNLIFFTADIPLTDASWCTYAFVMAAYILLLSTPLFAKGSSDAILQGSLWVRASIYFFSELIAAAIFIAINPDAITWPVIVQGCMLAFFIIFQLMGVLANDATTDSLARQRELAFEKQSLIEELQNALQCAGDPKAKSMLHRAIDAISNSPLRTCPQAIDADRQVRDAVNEVSFAIDGDFNPDMLRQKVNTLLQAVQKRNLIIRKYIN